MTNNVIITNIATPLTKKIMWYSVVLVWYSVVLVWYPCCTSEYHRNYHRNEKYTTQVLW